MVDVTTYSDARQNLAKLLDRVVLRAPLVERGALGGIGDGARTTKKVGIEIP